jgi:hypothetical protein
MDNRRNKEIQVINKIYELKAEIQSITNELEDPNPRFPINELYELKADLKKLKEVERSYILKLREINPQSSVLRNTLQIHNSTILLNEEEEKVYPFEIQQQRYNNVSVFGKKKSKTLRKSKGNPKPNRRSKGTSKRRGKGNQTPKKGKEKAPPKKGKVKSTPKNK